jgi:hypothetical protein
MSRRHRADTSPGESDSFLDVVANIVGILIILIVIAGVRVSQTAAVPTVAVEQKEPAAPSKPALVPVVAPRPFIMRAPQAPTPQAPEASSALLASIDSIVREIERLKAEQHSLRLTSETERQAIAATQDALATATVRQTAVEDELARVELDDRELATQIDDLQSELDGIGRQISDVPAEKVTVLHHRLNPIGREVHGQELHFRIAGGRVAKVPIEELVELLKPQIERQKEWIAKYHRQQGSVGPIDGFSMEYIVERQELSVLEELRAGAQMMRISVTGWKAVPEPNLVTESADEALRPDSRFMQALHLADKRTTLTFWVYRDSFEAYRTLQEAAHAEGLSVAGRPLPPGVPIAGSPSGSRSSSQ